MAGFTSSPPLPDSALPTGKATLEALGRYQDELRRVNGEWLFQYRRVYIDGHG